MPKQPRIRLSYLSDAKYLRRLALALEEDDGKSWAWRNRLADIVRFVASELEHDKKIEKGKEIPPKEEA